MSLISGGKKGCHKIRKITTTNQFFDKLSKDGTTGRPPNGMDLSDAWTVAVVEGRDSQTVRHRHWPTIFNAKSLQSDYLHKGQAAKLIPVLLPDPRFLSYGFITLSDNGFIRYILRSSFMFHSSAKYDWFGSYFEDQDLVPCLQSCSWMRTFAAQTQEVET